MALLVRLGNAPTNPSEILSTLSRKELTKQLEIILGAIELVEADIRLDSDTRTGIPEIGVGTGYDSESLSLWFPGKVKDSVCKRI